MPKRESIQRDKVTITLQRWVLEAVDSLADEIGGSRSDVISELLAYCFQKEEVVNEVFPYEDDEETT